MPLNFEVFDLDFPAGSPNKSATLITGPSKAMLVDAGFTRADGHRLVAAILDAGKELETVFISHADPDYYFGLEVIADAFPNATILATPIVIKHIQATFEGKLNAWAALGANLPTRLAAIAPLTAGAIEFEGYRFELRGGSDLLPDRHYLYNADQNAVVGGVLVFQQEHVWTADTATPEQRSAWIELLDEMQTLNPELVVAGHRLPGTANDSTGIDYTRSYLREFERILGRSADAASVTAALTESYPNSGMLIAAQIGPKVAKGEMTWG
jgi:glyoxylase-like metal-dependent hydrolase (beta-lactamase superfamily II)